MMVFIFSGKWKVDGKEDLTQNRILVFDDDDK